MSSAKGYYDVTTKLREILESDDSINNVLYGSEFDFANDKSNMYPVAIFNVTQSEMTEQTFRFGIDLMCCSLIDVTNEEATDKFVGNDNKMDVLNTLHASVSRAVLMLRSYDVVQEGYQLTTYPVLLPIENEGIHGYSGWETSFVIEVTQDMNVGC